MSPEQVEAFGAAWLRAWAARDLEAILAHYTEDIELRSPLVVRLLNRPSGTIVGKEDLRGYVRQIFAAFPADSELTLKGVYQGVGSLVIVAQATTGTLAEVMEFDDEGRVRRALAHGRAA